MLLHVLGYAFLYSSRPKESKRLVQTKKGYVKGEAIMNDHKLSVEKLDKKKGCLINLLIKFLAHQKRNR